MININLEILMDKNLSPNEYCILYCIYNNKNPKDELCYIPDELYNSLPDSGYLRENPDSTSNYPYSLTGEGLKLFETDDDSFISFVETYRNLFPKGIKSGNGTPIKGDKQGVAKKMEWFIRTYPEYSFTTIIAATKLYVEQMQRKGYAYMVQADYLINKDGLSKLAAMCEDFNVKTAHIIGSGERRL
jgi:hypothetical protein